MKIQKALPLDMYARAAKRSQEPGWAELRDTSIENLKKWAKDPRINKKVLPCLNMSYGKDSSAAFILCKMAGIKFISRYLDNRADVATHELVIPEFDKFIGQKTSIFRTEYSYIEYLKMCIDWGRTNNVTQPDGSPLNFFQLGKMQDVFLWKVSFCFDADYYPGEEDILQIWANRSSEGMHKMFVFKKMGDFQEIKPKNSSEVRFWKAEPLANWKAMDVWALLVSENAPVSPIYSYNAIPQRKGSTGKFPQTVWYPACFHWSSEFYRWMAKYSPVQLKVLLDTFPEVRMMFQK